MARWATLCELAGVVYTGCRVELVDAGAFKSQNVGSVDWANDGTPVVQTVNRGVKGIQFGLKMVSAEGTKLQDLFNAIVTAEGTESAVVVKVTDGIFTVNVNAVPDYSQDWFTFEKHSEGWYENVTLRFISISQGA